jgi:phage terminase large subunit
MPVGFLFGVDQMKVNLTIDPKVFNPVYKPYLGWIAPLEIYYGGSSSGKSYFLAQRCVLDMLKGGHNYLVIRKVANTLKRSVFNEIQKAISFFKVGKLFTVNMTDLIITCSNGYQIVFCGLDDPEKVKSITPSQGVITDIWFEEATESEYEDIQQLDKRLRGQSKVKKRIILSFNPIYMTHWIYTNHFRGRWTDNVTFYKDENISILKTTYKDNQFLTPDDIVRLEATKDKYYRDVYLLGMWGTLGKVIFTNWRIEDLAEKAKSFSTFQNGLDFGFAADPSAITHMHYDRQSMTLYLLDAKYCYGMTNDLLATEIKNLIGRAVITCDCAAPLNIQELRQYGVTATPCTKGKDSVNFGIQWLQTLQIVIDYRLKDAINEFTVYKWREDKDGNVLPEPVDKNNHIIDSIRYGLEQEMGKTKQAYDVKSRAKSRYNPFKRVR